MRPYQLSLLASFASALPSPQRPSWHPDTDSVVYFLENNPAGNNIVSIPISPNGRLSDPARTPTDGVGSLSLNSTGFPMSADPLGSQGSIVVKDGYLFTVNAGSNTLSVFEIDPGNALHPRLVGSPVDTLGQFPMSVDYSPQLKQACVLNGGADAGVACFSVDAWKGLSPLGPLRPLAKDIIDETTPPHGPPGSSGQILFNPDSTAVFASIKGNPESTPVKLGSLVAWPIIEGSVSHADPTVTRLSGLVLDFGFTFTDESTIFLVDPSFGAAILHVQLNFTLIEEVHVAISGQVAACWTQQLGTTLYAIDAGVPKIWTLDAGTGALTGAITVTAPGAAVNITGVFDSAINNGLMYSLTAENGISVTDLAEKVTVQYLDLEGFGQREYYTGMAIWIGR
jgi:hypothetical protein